MQLAVKNFSHSLALITLATKPELSSTVELIGEGVNEEGLTNINNYSRTC
jgi:hypothetical protein